MPVPANYWLRDGHRFPCQYPFIGKRRQLDHQRTINQLEEITMKSKTAKALPPSPSDFPLYVRSADDLYDQLLDGDVHQDTLVENNSFFRLADIHLIDLDAYGEPAANVVNLVGKGSCQDVTDREILREVRQAMRLWRKVNDAVEKQYA
jgi:hypothetical protein